MEAAEEAKVFDDIILSTDAEEIAEVGRSYGATVPGLRPSALATDDSDVFETHRYIFEQMNIADKTHRVCILTNNPFINDELIKKGYRKACSVNFERIVLDTVPVAGDYVYYAQCYKKEGLLRFRFPDEMLKSGINRQNISPTFTTINNMRWGKPSVLNDYEVYKKDIVNNGIVSIDLPKLRNIDLDDSDDWLMAEAVFEKIVVC